MTRYKALVEWPHVNQGRRLPPVEVVVDAPTAADALTIARLRLDAPPSYYLPGGVIVDLQAVDPPRCPKCGQLVRAPS